MRGIILVYKLQNLKYNVTETPTGRIWSERKGGREEGRGTSMGAE